jgi:putative membrane protein
MPTTMLGNLLAAAVFSILGIVLFIAAFFLFEKITPGLLWKEVIEEHNTALAVLIGAIAIGLSIIISAAIT